VKAIIPSNFIRPLHQLVIVCSISEAQKSKFEAIGQKLGVSTNQIIFTGFVTDEELRQLYNLADLFIFPSIHEGFGLPALEAMQCNTPVIVSATSSLPEVVEHPQALFDPNSIESITQKITQVLTQPELKAELTHHTKQQTKKFNWALTAQRALNKIQAHAQTQPTTHSPRNPTKPKLAFLSPLPPAQSGISDYSIELLQSLITHYDITLISDQDDLQLKQLSSTCAVMSTTQFKTTFTTYDRVLYHIGNSHFHETYLTLLKHYPGVIVLHDFYLSGMQSWSEMLGLRHNAFNQALYESHGYPALFERLTARDNQQIIMKYPCNYQVLADALGVIVHSKYALTLKNHWYSAHLPAQHYRQIPLLRQPAPDITPSTKSQLKSQYGLSSDSLVICSFGFLDKTKLNHRLLDAFLASKLTQDHRIHLIFVGKNAANEYGQALIEKIKQSGLTNRIKITGWSEAQTYQDYLKISDIAVQLRTLSRGETSAAVLDCMNYAIPTIVNANGSMAELDEQSVILLPDHFNDQQLSQALEQLANDQQLRNTIGQRAQNHIKTTHHPDTCAQAYHEAIEQFYTQNPPLHQWLGNHKRHLQTLKKSEQMAFASAIATSLPTPPPKPRIFIDITPWHPHPTHQQSAQQVTAALASILQKQYPHLRLEPVYRTKHDEAWQYRFATSFTLALYNYDTKLLNETAIDAQNADTLILIEANDNQHKDLVESGLYDYYQNLGVTIHTATPSSLLNDIESLINQIDEKQKHENQTVN
jgi:glycosyltransferase involved in cell wall biosynthesis